MGLENNTVLATIQTQPELQLPSPALYGRSEIIASAQESKAVRKAKQRILSLKDRGVIDQQVEVGEQALMHTKNGDVYTAVQTGDMHPLFIKADIAYDVSQPNEGCIITGTCLFGDHHAQAVTDTGKHISLVNKKQMDELNGDIITEIHTYQGMHPYEIDSLVRLGKAFSLIAPKRPRPGLYTYSKRGVLDVSVWSVSGRQDYASGTTALVH